MSDNGPALAHKPTLTTVLVNHFYTIFSFFFRRGKVQLMSDNGPALAHNPTLVIALVNHFCMLFFFSFLFFPAETIYNS